MATTNDPLQRFPNEITSAIFSFLKFRECVRLTAVCRSWRQFLLDWPLMWKTLDDPECDFGRDLLPYKRFIKHDAIKCLDLENLNFDQQSRALSFMVDIGCTSLKMLKLRFRDIMWESLEQVLQLSSHSIIELCIYAQQGQLYLHRILQQCQHIKAIYYRQPGEFDNSSASRIYYDKLCFPHVEAINVKSTRAAKQVLDELDLPNLKLLRISNPIGSLRNAQWPQLRALELRTPLRQGQPFQNIPIERMPCLESVSIAPIHMTDELLDAIGNLGNLKELHLGSPCRGSSDDPQWSEKGVIRMLQGRCRQTLQYLNLNYYHGLISDNVLDAIADIITAGRLSFTLTVYISTVESPTPEAQPLLRRTRTLFSTEIGLRRFASRIADFRVPLLNFTIYGECSDDTIKFMRDKLGVEGVIHGSNFSILRLRNGHEPTDIPGVWNMRIFLESNWSLPQVHADIYSEVIGKFL